jgi:octaprenyl-diphosphate synthase
MTTKDLESIRGLVSAELSGVDEMVRRALSSGAKPLQAAVQHLLGTGGKRIRALLSLLAGRATSVQADRTLVVASAAEMVHAASLCHDDVLDRGTLRRGRPTVRVEYGDAMSILLGDFCLTRAFRLLSRHGLSEQAVGIADAVVEMAEGEVAQAGKAPSGEQGVEHYLRVASGKTGALLSWCATVGALVPPHDLPILSQFGQRLGRVYQIADDLLDFEDEGVSGKEKGQDLVRGAPTMPVLVACELQPDLCELLLELRKVRSAEPQAVDALIAEIHRVGALDKVREIARREAEAAVKIVYGLAPSPYREALATLAWFAADRHV